MSGGRARRDTAAVVVRAAAGVAMSTSLHDQPRRRPARSAGAHAAGWLPRRAVRQRAPALPHQPRPGLAGRAVPHRCHDRGAGLVNASIAMSLRREPRLPWWDPTWLKAFGDLSRLGGCVALCGSGRSGRSIPGRLAVGRAARVAVGLAASALVGVGRIGIVSLRPSTATRGRSPPSGRPVGGCRVAGTQCRRWRSAGVLLRLAGSTLGRDDASRLMPPVVLVARRRVLVARRLRAGPGGCGPGPVEPRGRAAPRAARP
jgi:hypothetical protein